MYCNRLHAWWSTQSRLATLLSSLIVCWWVRLQTLWRFRLKDFKYFYWPFHGGDSFVDYLCYFCLVFVMLTCTPVCWCLVVTSWQKGWPLGFLSDCEVVTFPLVSWVRCGAWLYRYLILALFLTFIYTSTRLNVHLIFCVIQLKTGLSHRI